MCTNCGCGLPDHFEPRLTGAAADGRAEGAHAATSAHTASVLRRLLAANDDTAAHNREHLNRHRTFAVNLMSSPGAGKTALLERTVRDLGTHLRIAVVVGDLETQLDAERLRRCGVAAMQISTGQACHLDARMLHDALHSIDLASVDLLFIENVGNLVCPASFDLGQHQNVVLLAASEGHDKPAKYPVMFRKADLVLLSKADLVPLLGDFDPGLAEGAVRQLASESPVWTVSARSGEGMARWCQWLLDAVLRHRSDDSEAQRVSEGAGPTWP
jgi:hydrogenase nickel incorporation protein HypB